MDDQRLITDVVYGEWARLQPCQRTQSHWLTDATMVEWLERLFPPYPPSVFMATLATLEETQPACSQAPMLLGKPVEVRESAEGCRLVVDGGPEPESVFRLAF